MISSRYAGFSYSIYSLTIILGILNFKHLFSQLGIASYFIESMWKASMQCHTIGRMERSSRRQMRMHLHIYIHVIAVPLETYNSIAICLYCNKKVKKSQT